ncbi:MAG: VOC family protein [Thermomicrobiales bacterium]
MSETTQIGRFVWRDLMTTDPEKAEAFYSGLFGWSVNPVDMGNLTYRMLRNGETDFGGIVDINEVAAGQGIPPHWVSYINVPNVDETTAKVTQLGGKVHLQPTDIPGVGRFAVAEDPTGAVFQPFQDSSGEAPPETNGVPSVGGITWNELQTSDVEAAKAFYAGLVGYGLDSMTMGDGPPYSMFKRGERMEGGVWQKPDTLPMSTWIIYYCVADIDQSVADVNKFGGAIVGEVMEVPTIGRMAWATDPTGALFAIHEPAPV